MILMIAVITMVLFTLLAAVYHTARANKQFTFVRTGEIKFIVVGEGFDRLLMDMPGYAYDQSSDEIRAIQESQEHGALYRFTNQHRWEWVRKLAGIYYVSLFYPFRKIHHWKFEWDKQTKQASGSGSQGTIESYSVVHRNEWVDSLFFEFAYPLHSRNLELGGGGSVDIRARFVLQIVKPRYLVFTLNGTWYPAAMNAIEAKKADFAKSRTIESMFDPKITNSDAFNKWFTDDPLILLGSIRVVEAILEGFEQTGSTEEREALGKRRVSEIGVETGKNEGRREAERTRAEAAGEADAIIATGKAKAEAARMMGDALGHQRDKLGDPLMERKLQADTVGGFTGTALSLGGGGHQVLVSADEKPGKKGGAS